MRPITVAMVAVPATYDDYPIVGQAFTRKCHHCHCNSLKDQKGPMIYNAMSSGLES